MDITVALGGGGVKGMLISACSVYLSEKASASVRWLERAPGFVGRYAAGFSPDEIEAPDERL
jgi:hypothetical protein